MIAALQLACNLPFKDERRAARSLKAEELQRAVQLPL
jgi:hypothetical protein